MDTTVLGKVNESAIALISCLLRSSHGLQLCLIHLFNAAEEILDLLLGILLIHLCPKLVESHVRLITNAKIRSKRHITLIEAASRLSILSQLVALTFLLQVRRQFLYLFKLG